MLFNDLFSILQWWLVIFIIGVIFLPLTKRIFSTFFDRGYIFAKFIGIALMSYTVFVLGFFKLLPFETQNIFLIAGAFLLINLFIKRKNPLSGIRIKALLPIFILEECMFLGILLLWSFIHAYQPDIHGLEKYMDFGFINSILRTKYFPPLDMWFTPYAINYYYFGHLITAILTKISFLPSGITFNLMLSTVAAMSFTASFSIATNLVKYFKSLISNLKLIAGGLLTAFLLNFAGNLHTLYLFFKPYLNDNPVPFWQLAFSPLSLPNGYWYPNATRFIHNTIHEFPIYSYVVSDLHGHFLDIPFVLLTIAILFSLLLKYKLKNINWKLEIPVISFLLAIMYMTNAWDGIIYFIMAVFIVGVIVFKSATNTLSIQSFSLKFKVFINSFVPKILLLGLIFFLFALPFSLNFKPFASGIGILCAPKFLTDLGKLGPLLFEADHCQHSPIWQLGILYGFFYFWVISFGVFLLFKIKSKHFSITPGDIFVIILIILSTILTLVPEFIYVKDIYPAHYRANTMFKLVYQAFIMLSLSSGYIIIRLVSSIKHYVSGIWGKILTTCYLLFATVLLILVFIYPYFAINSYFGDLKNYAGLNGINYLNTLYPNDYAAIQWLNKNIKGQPIILEAQGDSYTDFGRVSTNTGLPTVLGWTVHEWLWRGTYDIPAPRIPEVQKMYESTSLPETKTLLKKYAVTLVFVGDLERQKYPKLNEEKYKSLGKVIFKKGNTSIYKIN